MAGVAVDAEKYEDFLVKSEGCAEIAHIVERVDDVEIDGKIDGRIVLVGVVDDADNGCGTEGKDGVDG